MNVRWTKSQWAVVIIASLVTIASFAYSMTHLAKNS